MPLAILIVLALVATVVAGLLFRGWLQYRRAEFIRTYTWPRGLLERLEKHRPGLERKDSALVSRGLRQFFIAYLMSGRRFVSMPSQVADELWHEFILYTRDYDSFCRRAFGTFCITRRLSCSAPSAATTKVCGASGGTAVNTRTSAHSSRRACHCCSLSMRSSRFLTGSPIIRNASHCGPPAPPVRSIAEVISQMSPTMVGRPVWAISAARVVATVPLVAAPMSAGRQWGLFRRRRWWVRRGRLWRRRWRLISTGRPFTPA